MLCILHVMLMKAPVYTVAISRFVGKILNNIFMYVCNLVSVKVAAICVYILLYIIFVTCVFSCYKVGIIM